MDDPHWVEEFGEALKRLRVERGMSREDVVGALAARGLVVDLRRYTGWENGEYKPRDRREISVALDEILAAEGDLAATLGYSMEGPLSLSEMYAELRESQDAIRELRAQVARIAALVEALESPNGEPPKHRPPPPR